jgi:hypothetical protein
LLAINAGELLCIADILSVLVRHFGMIGFRCSYRREGGKRRLLYLAGSDYNIKWAGPSRDNIDKQAAPLSLEWSLLSF